jgi:hypothetical protein
VNITDCPYCFCVIELDDDNFIYENGEIDESKNNHRKCTQCGKAFLFDVNISISFDSKACKCLNDGIHEWVFIRNRDVRDSHFECKGCGNLRSMTDEERLKVVYDHARAGGVIHHD